MIVAVLGAVVEGLSLGKPHVVVDYGLKRVGVGVGTNWGSRPLRVLKHHGNETLVACDLIRIAHMERATDFVVGLPLSRNGSESFMSNITRLFAQQLCDLATVALPDANVYLSDERFSTKEARALVGDSDLLDAVAACSILDDFFAYGEAERLDPHPDALARRTRLLAEKNISSDASSDGDFYARAKANLQHNKRLLRYIDED